MHTYFKIGPLAFYVSSINDFPWTEDVKIFQKDTISENTNLLKYTLDFVKTFSPLWGKILYRDNSMIVMLINNIEHRIHLLSNSGEPYALIRHIDEKYVQICIDERALPVLKWDRSLVGLFSLEHYCLAYHSFLLHASYIIYQGKAIIFTAPSGTGKSTQADLWAKYENAKIINGDRTLLIYENEQWYASGFPVCGSSDYCLNEIAPIQAVICLEQGTANLSLRLSPVQALSKIYSQSFINRWNPDDCNKISMLISDLVQDVPVYHYSCTKERDAVYDLKKIIIP